MLAPTDRYHELLRRASEAYLASGLDAGREILRPIAGEIWNGLQGFTYVVAVPPPWRPGIGREEVTPILAAKIFQRDQFQCRYCGCDTIPKPIAVLLHTLYPAELPFHEHYHAGRMHPLFWTRVAEIDHLKPSSRGGSWTDPMNLVTACVVCNTKKGDHTIEELGWRLRIPAPGWDGLVPLYEKTWQQAGRPKSAYHGKWVRAFANATT